MYKGLQNEVIGSIVAEDQMYCGIEIFLDGDKMQAELTFDSALSDGPVVATGHEIRKEGDIVQYVGNIRFAVMTE